MSIEDEMRKAGILHNTEPYRSLDEMHADPAHEPYPPGTNPFSAEAARDPEEEEDEITIDINGVMRRNGVVEKSGVEDE